MEKIEHKVTLTKFKSITELNKPDQDLVNLAIEATQNAYAVYSGFHVGAALLLSNNQIIAVCYYKDGSSKRYQINAEFSNRRMVIADFNKFSAVLAELLKKFPRHFLWMSAIAATDVTQKLIDGLTDIEIKVIREAIWVSARQAKRSVVSTTVGYQGQVVSQ